MKLYRFTPVGRLTGVVNHCTLLLSSSTSVALYETSSRTESVKTVTSLDRGLEILELLGERGELRLAEVAAILQVSRPTAFRLLASLQERGYVEHARSEHVYRLGQAIHVLAARAEPDSLLRLAEPALVDLRELSGETTNLALVLRRSTIVYAAILDGVHALRMSAEVGESVPPHATALGKAVLSALPRPAAEAMVGPEPFEKFTVNTMVGWSGLGPELERVRQRGYATDDEECDMGAYCVAGVIVGHDGLPVGGISVSGLAARMTQENRVDLGQAVRGWCGQVSKQVSEARSTRGSSPKG